MPFRHLTRGALLGSLLLPQLPLGKLSDEDQKWIADNNK